MPLIVPSPYKGYPPRWGVFDTNVQTVGPQGFGFRGSAAEVNRFAARYRAARCFRHVEFDGLTLDTAQGYSRLCLLLLTYSAFEYFLRAIGIDQRNTGGFLTDAERDRILGYVRALNGQHELFSFIRPYVRRSHQNQLDLHLNQKPCNPFYLASSIRHLFAHGILTPSPAGVPPRAVTKVSRYLSQVLIKVMDREFEERMVAFERHNAAPKLVSR